MKPSAFLPSCEWFPQVTVLHENGNLIVLLSWDLRPPLGTPLLFRDGIPVFKTSNMFLQTKLWSAVDLSPASAIKPDLALFFVPGLTENTLGKALATPSRAAYIGPGGATNFACAHELGHCFGLQHAPNGANPSGLPILPDRGALRLMGYGRGKILRFKEAEIVNKWRAATTVQPGQLGPN